MGKPKMPVRTDEPAAVWVDRSALHAWAENPRKNDGEPVRKVMESIRRFGFAAPIVARTNGEVIAGHTRLKAAEALGLDRVPVRYMNLDPAEAHLLALADNKLNEEAEWDAAAVASILSDFSFEDAALAGWDSDDLEKLADELGANEPREVEEDEVPEPPAVAVTKPGDLWILGEHRLLCGDSTKAEDVARLMNGERISLLLADPPYFGKVDEDWDNDFEGGYEGFLSFLDDVFGLWIPLTLDRGTSGWWCAPDFAWHIEERLRKHAAIFNHIVWFKGRGLGTMVSLETMRRWRPRSERLLLCEKLHSPDALLAAFNQKTAHIAARSAYSSIIDRMMSWQKQAKLTNKEIDACLGKNGMAGHYFGRSQWGLPTRDAWEKLRTLFLSRGVDMGEWQAQRSEFDAQRREFDAQRSEFDDNKTDVWEMSAPYGEERHGHPTPKPLALISKLVSAHSRPNDLLADPFLGSGTTLIAAEQTQRKCYGMEIDPHYCDVIVKRWETLTGKKAELAL